MSAFQQNKTDEPTKSILLITGVLLVVTTTLLFCSYLYYKIEGKYDKAEYCFNNRCFVLTSSIHIRPNEFQQVKFKQRPAFIVPDKNIQDRYLHYLRSDIQVRCRNDKKCMERVNNSDIYKILEMKIQGNWFNPFIEKTHRSFSGALLRRLGDKSYSQQKVKTPWIKKTVSLIKEYLNHPEAARFREVVLRLDEQGFPIICGEVADNFNANNFVKYITSFVSLNYQPFIYLGRNDLVLWSKTKDKSNSVINRNVKQTDFTLLWKNRCYQG